MQPGSNTPSPVISAGTKVRIDVIGIIRCRHPLVTRHHITSLRISRLRHRLKGDLAGPLVLAGPAGHRYPAIGHRPQWYAAAITVAIRTMHIGIDHIVDWLSPFAHGLLQFVRRARQQQLVDTVSPRRSAACTGVAEGQACAAARVASDNRPMVCSDDIEILRCCTTRAELFVRYLSWEPGVFIGILEPAILRAKTLDKQVLIISIAMRHAPGHVRRIA